MKRAKLLTLIGFLLALLFSAEVLAAFPEREITFYCSSSAGGMTDLTARYFAERLSKSFGQPIVVNNKPGAAHTICINLISKAAPDGYSVGVVGGSGLMVVPNLRKLTYNPLGDFTYIATCGEYPAGLTVLANAPWNNLEEFLDYGKKNPGKIIYSSDGHGSAAHMTMEYIAKKKGGVIFKHVPYSGGARNAPALLGGHTHAWAASGSQVKFIRDGKMKLLAGFNEERAKYAPNIPTLKELGYTNHSASILMVIIAPKGLPDSVLKKLETSLLNAMKESSYEGFMDKFETVPVLLGSNETANKIKELLKSWKNIVEVTGIKESE